MEEGAADPCQPPGASVFRCRSSAIGILTIKRVTRKTLVLPRSFSDRCKITNGRYRSAAGRMIGLATDSNGSSLATRGACIPPEPAYAIRDAKKIGIESQARQKILPRLNRFHQKKLCPLWRKPTPQVAACNSLRLNIFAFRQALRDTLVGGCCQIAMSSFRLVCRVGRAQAELHWRDTFREDVLSRLQSAAQQTRRSARSAERVRQAQGLASLSTD